MGLALPGFPAYPEHTTDVTLGDAQYRLHYVWRARTGSWYVDVYAIDGTPLALGVALRTGWAPLRLLVDPRLPAGVVYVRGPASYLRSDLGAGLRVMSYALDEIPAVPDDGVSARIP